MRRTLEVVFRHLIQFLLLLVLFPAIGVGIIYFAVPRTYTATASLWALQRSFVIGSTGPESDLKSTPAQTQVTSITELLKTYSFVEAVVKGIDFTPTLGLSDSTLQNPAQLQNAVLDDFAKHMVVAPVAYNLFTITYSNRNSQVARKVVAAVIANYGPQSLALSVAEGKNLLAYYQSQLASAQTDLNNALAAEKQYLSQHPELLVKGSQITDPNYTLLDNQRSQDEKNVQHLKETINTIQSSINSVGANVGTLYQVIDPPQLLGKPDSRTKEFLIGGGVGLGVVILAYAFYLAVVTRKDRGIYSLKELQGLVEFPIIMQLPELTPTTLSLLIKGATQAQVQLIEEKNNADGRFAK